MSNQRRNTRRLALALALLLAAGAPAAALLPETPTAAAAERDEPPRRDPEMGALAARLAENAVAAAQSIVIPQNPYRFTVDGLPLGEDPMAEEVEGTVYVSLPALAAALLPEAVFTWDGETAALTLEGVMDLTARLDQPYAAANGRCLYVPLGLQVAEDTPLLPLDTLLKVFDASGEWDEEEETWAVTSGSGAILPGEEFYDRNDLYWLSRIINAESGNQPLSGKIAVGNVVLNRVAAKGFPNTVKGVIYQKNQFSPARSGSVRKTPNAESVLAAKLCLDGAVSLERVLFFNRKGLKCWASRNRSYVATIGGHTFYA